MNRRGFLRGLLATAVIAVVPSPLSLPGAGVAKVLTFDEHMAAFSRILIDNITRPSPLWLMLKDRGLIGEPVSGEDIWEPIHH